MISNAATLSPSLSLHEWACLRTELIWIYDHEVEPRYQRWPGGRRGAGSDGYRVWYVRRGTVTMTLGRKRVSAGAGKWVIPAPRSETVFSSNAHILSLHFLCQWPSGEGVLRGHEGMIVDGRDDPEMETLARELHRRLQAQFPGLPEQEHVYSGRSSTFDNFLGIQGVFLAWLARWFRALVESGATPTRLAAGDARPSQAARCLNTAPLAQGFPAERISRETGLGLMRLNQLFYAEFGLTTRKYWDRRRLEFARQCLETSRMPVKEIAFALGFRSDSHFAVWFKRLDGSRPGERRKTGKSAP